MISIRSVNGHEANMADYVANVLRELGMDPITAILKRISPGSGPRFGQRWTADAPARRCS